MTNSKQSKTYSAAPSFSRIYVEKGAFDYPDTQSVLARFPRAKLIKVDNYKEVFNRPRQDWRGQKRSQNLILAVKKNNYLYPGVAVTPSFDHPNFFYNSLILNCVYDCQYCYLQGLYPSANLVLFVNSEDFFSATSTALEKLGSMYLCISYDTDLLAVEDLIPYSSRWIEYSRQYPELLIELRTKSANTKPLRNIDPVENIILAWTISPADISKKYEPKAPPLRKRLEAIAEALERGWNVRLCIDPVLAVDAWQLSYSTMLEEIQNTIPVSRLYDVSIGDFRINRDMLKRIQRQRQDSDLLFYPFETKQKLAIYPHNVSEELLNFVREGLCNIGVPHSKVLRVEPFEDAAAEG